MFSMQTPSHLPKPKLGQKGGNEVVEEFFDDISTECQAYWLGFVQADGCVSNPNGSSYTALSITLKESDKDHLEKFNAALGSTCSVKIRHYKKEREWGGTGTATTRITRKRLVGRLSDLGIVTNRGEEPWLSNVVPESLMRHYLRGVVDGDGYVCDPEYPQVGLTATKGFLRKFVGYCIDQLDCRRKTICPNQSMWRVAYFGTEGARLMAHLYGDATWYLDRKMDMAERCIGETLRVA